jgi:sterol desaturase/sphingolipid hydroxylase (fatty acid hydroxylase superfamily)
MKVYSKMIVILLTISLVWVYLLLNLLYSTYSQETCFLAFKTGNTIQFTIVYILGILISMGYLGLILFKKD